MPQGIRANQRLGAAKGKSGLSGLARGGATRQSEESTLLARSVVKPMGSGWVGEEQHSQAEVWTLTSCVCQGKICWVDCAPPWGKEKDPALSSILKGLERDSAIQ